MFAKVIAKNIKFSAINKAVNMLYSIIFFPFIIHYVGQEMYGVYILVLTISGYLSLLDLGVGSAVVKYVSEHSARGEDDSINRTINFSLTFFIAIAVIIAVFLFAFSFVFDSFFKVAGPNKETARQLFWLAGLTALVYWPGFLFKNVLMGLQRYDWSSAGDIIIVVANALAALLLFPRGGNIAQFQAVAFFVSIAVLVLYFVKTRSLIKNLRLQVPYTDRETYKRLFSYGTFLFLSGILGMVIFQIGSIFTGLFVSVAAVTLYGVAFSMQQNIRSINSVISSPIMPAASELHGKEDAGSQRDIFLRGTRFSTAMFFPIVIISVIFAGKFILTWMGPSFSDSVLPARILLVFWFFSGVINIGSNILYGRGVVRIFFLIDIICAVSAIVMSFVFVKSFGITGVAMALALTMVFLNFPLVLYFILKNIGVTLKSFYDNCIKCNVLLYVVTVVMAATVNIVYSPKNIFLLILGMLGIYMLSMAVYYFLMLTKNERAAIRRILSV